MQILKCGNKYINMDQVTYIEWLDGVEVFAVHFAVYKPSAGQDDIEETDYRLYLETDDEIEPLQRWLDERSNG